MILGVVWPAWIGAAPVLRPFIPLAGRAAMTWFNVLGILDLVAALVVGALLLPSTLAITEAPLVLIPATAVPLALALHVNSIRRSFTSRALQSVG